MVRTSRSVSRGSGSRFTSNTPDTLPMVEEKEASLFEMMQNEEIIDDIDDVIELDEILEEFGRNEASVEEVKKDELDEI